MEFRTPRRGEKRQACPDKGREKNSNKSHGAGGDRHGKFPGRNSGEESHPFPAIPQAHFPYLVNTLTSSI